MGPTGPSILASTQCVLCGRCGPYLCSCVYGFGGLIVTGGVMFLVLIRPRVDFSASNCGPQFIFLRNTSASFVVRGPCDVALMGPSDAPWFGNWK